MQNNSQFFFIEHAELVHSLNSLQLIIIDTEQLTLVNDTFGVSYACGGGDETDGNCHPRN
jgi:hypothetical protein